MVWNLLSLSSFVGQCLCCLLNYEAIRRHFRYDNVLLCLLRQIALHAHTHPRLQRLCCPYCQTVPSIDGVQFVHRLLFLIPMGYAQPAHSMLIGRCRMFNQCHGSNRSFQENLVHVRSSFLHFCPQSGNRKEAIHNCTASFLKQKTAQLSKRSCYFLFGALTLYHSKVLLSR